MTIKKARRGLNSLPEYNAAIRRECLLVFFAPFFSDRFLLSPSTPFFRIVDLNYVSVGLVE